MALAHPAESPGWSEAEELLDGFEAAWNRGKAPAIDAVLAKVSGTLDGVLRRRFLEELIKIDLGQRWRRARKPASGGSWDAPRLEDYLKRYTDLGTAEELSVELIAEEYWARQRWGDRPTADEYAARFARQAATLRPVLRRIDADLASEFARDGGPPAPPPVPAPPPARPAPAEAPRPPATAAAFLGTVRLHGLLDRSRLDAVAHDLLGRHSEPRELARELIRRNWLTPYQVNQVLIGRAQDLVLGPYQLLERLGEGGVGQVFKAQHTGTGRIVALKVIRKDLVTDPEVVARFYREVKILGELAHPNIVQRVDAGQVGTSQVLAMEYIEGVDLARLVKATGPLPVAQACDYIRQAALGLQHAHERGLVHRDIKPSNLLVTSRTPGARASTSSSHLGRWTLDIGLIKILDLGLARLRRPPSANEATMVTKVGSVLMGTPDFLAPEQALDFHAADIRSDIYSLGCTFYYLLAGQPPFAGGSLAQKLVMHREAEPLPLDSFRSDLPRGLGKVLGKMLAKRPQDRYQTPAEVAQAIAALQAPGRPAPKDAAALWQRRRQWLLVHRRAVLIGTCGVVAAGGLGWLGLSLLRKTPDKPPSVVVPLPTAAEALQQLRAQFENPQADASQLRQAIVKFRTNYPGTREERVAVDMLQQLSSPLDQYRGEGPPAAPPPPKELLALFGKPGQAAILGVAVSPEGRLVAAGRDDGFVQIWDAATGKELAAFAAQRGPVQAIAFAPDGQTLATTGTDGMVRLWTSSGAELGTWPGSSNLWLAYAPDGRTLVAGGTQNIVRAWDLKKEERVVVSESQPVISGAFNPDGQILAVGCARGNLSTWEVATGRRLLLVRPAAGIPALAWSPDGRYLALGCQEGVVRLWDVPAAKEVLPPKGTAIAPMVSVAFAPSGKTLASVDQAGEVVVWDLRSGQRVRHWPMSARATRVAYASDGRHLAVGQANGTVAIFRWAPVATR
jgi:serine/threonine protein kinase